ncbi:MAG: thermonuclease family protein [Ardenticatenaceae bacterium]|nr:thermonuclease family protein [Ardenticatenaceae bacterium]
MTQGKRSAAGCLVTLLTTVLASLIGGTAALTLLLARATVAFGRWWWGVFIQQSPRGKAIFGGGSLLVVAALYIVGQIGTPNPAPAGTIATATHTATDVVATLERTVQATVAPRATEAPAATKTPRPTWTRRPLDTPTRVPTNTRVPTDTPAPTPTSTPEPSPTATNTPSVDPSESAYIQAVIELSESYAEAWTKASELATTVGSDVSLIFDQDWRTEMAVALGTVKANNARVRQLEAPARFAEVHAELLVAAAHYDRAVDLFAEGIDELNADKMTRAAAEIEIGNAAINRAAAKAQALKSSPTSLQSPAIEPSHPVPPPPAPATSRTTGAGHVLSVIDGDTIEVEIDGISYRVRYIGVDTPEQGMPFYAEATQANAALVADHDVWLEKDVSETDRYGRLLRYVYVGDTMVNAELARQGYAQVATFPPDVAHQAEFLPLEQEARAAGRGLWATVTVQPTAPPAQTGNCDLSYPDVCIPPPPPDLDCGEIPYRNFRVLPPDPHRFDRDKDGIGCES